MKEKIPENTATEVVNFVLISTLLALCTERYEDQEAKIHEVLREVADRTDRALTSGSTELELPESTRNELFAESVERISQIKKAALGIAKTMKG